MKRVILGLSVIIAAAFAQPAIEGQWEGAILIQDMELSMNMEFSQEDGELKGFIDIPQQGAEDIPLEDESFDEGKVHFELPANMTAVFSGELADGRITGTFTQGPAKGEFYLERKIEVVLPYTSEVVEIEVTEDVTLAGTLTIPEGEPPFPAVVLISGSGAQGRDVDIFGFKLFKTIADHLTRDGIAVLRCDDRGFAGSTGDRKTATSADYADDVLAQLAYLKTRSRIDTTRIGLLGHSEGALIAGMVAADNPDIEFIVLMGGTALPGDTALKAQLVRVLGAESSSQEMITEQQALQTKLLDYARTGKGEKKLRKELQELTAKTLKQRMTSEELEALGDFDAYVEQRVEAQMETVSSRWFRFFLDYDPRDDLGNVDARVLAFFGEKDVQAVAEENAPAMDEFFSKIGKSNYTIRVCCKANHLFQPAETGAVSEYSKLPKEFTPCFLPTVTAWILEEPIPEKCDETDESHQGCPRLEKQGCGGCPHK